MKIEITGVDPKRWAWLHLPLGVCLGFAFAGWYFFQENGIDAEMFVEGSMVVIFGIPCIVLAVMSVAWLQATILNGIFKMMGKGPILSVRTFEDESG